MLGKLAMDIKTIKGTIFVKPGAYLPILFSIAALSMVLVHYAISGIQYEADEGTLAHIFQLLMVIQLPIVGYFFIKWIQRNPKETLLIFALQALFGIAAIIAVIFLT